jgi:YggT family protein
METILIILRLIEALFLVRVLLSWIQPQGYNKYVRWIWLLTEPVLAPVRRVLPFSRGGFDFSPIVVFIVIDIIKQAVYGHF